jgi:hypothetical protein
MKNKLTTIKQNLVKELLTLVCLLFVTVSFSQKIEVIQKSDLKNFSEGKKFAFIEPATDTNNLEFVATILARDKNRKSLIEDMYFAIRERGNKMGANCYKIRTFNRDTLDSQAVLILDSYLASDSVLAQNTANHEKNVVFIFGNERDDDNSIAFNLNGEKKEIKAGTYYKITLNEKEEVKVNKGGFTGETMWLNWEEDKQPAFYTLSGFGLSDYYLQPISGISFNTGRINRIGNISVGLLLTQLLKKGN